jgi:hypothetical protein
MREKEVRQSRSAVLFDDKDNEEEGSAGNSSDYQATDNSDPSTK